MTYNLEAIKARLNATNKTQGRKTSQNTNKIKYFKVTLGPDNKQKTYKIRFAPFANSSGEPILTVTHYRKLKDFLKLKYKLIAPSQFGLEDPISEEFEATRNAPGGREASEEDRKKAWSYAKTLKPEEFAVVQILDRNAENEGWQFWEIDTALRDEIYTLMLLDEWKEEQIFDADRGYDFTLTVTHKIKDGKLQYFNNYPCKNIKLDPARKSSKLHADKEIAAKLMSEVLDLEKVYKEMVKPTEELHEKLQEYQITYNFDPSVPVGDSEHHPQTTAEAPSESDDAIDAAFSVA
jgi:hypothetical protein